MNETIRENSTWSILYSTKTATLMNILYKNSNYEYKEPTVKKLQLQEAACTYCTTTEQLYWATTMRIPYKNSNYMEHTVQKHKYQENFVQKSASRRILHCQTSNPNFRDIT